MVAPLDWGLGHATRCIPVIHALIHHNCNVMLAGEGMVQTLLQQEFPGLPFLPLKGYRIRYSKSRLGLPVVLALQIPKIIAAIRREHRWLQAAVKKYSIAAVISDNRYGLYHSVIPAVFITHQLLIKTPFGAYFLQKLVYRCLIRFTECWVPDNDGHQNLAGNLSHPTRKPGIPVKYIGPLSRLKRYAASSGNYLLILLSGPEPQRTLLEEKLLKEMAPYPNPVVLVRGLPGCKEVLTVAPNVTVYTHLPAAKLGEVMSEAAFIISRSGYSTVMDVLAMGRKAIFIPTPGQTEQEYLAAYLMEKKLAFSRQQKDFTLTEALEGAANFNYKAYRVDDNSKLEKTIKNLLDQS